MNTKKLIKEECVRYSRQLSLPGFGLEAQQKLKGARVLIVGAGGLGIPVLQYLVAAGVGTIGVVDHDKVELSNLHRQVIFRFTDVGRLKVAVAKEQLDRLNPHVEIETYPLKLEVENAPYLFNQYDMVVDGTDNLPTRYLINDQGVASGIPIIYGAIFRYEGQVSVFNYELASGLRSPNYRDLFPEQVNDRSIPNCSETGVIGVLPGIIGSFQAMEVIKLITGVGIPLAGKLLVVDTLTCETRILKYGSRTNTMELENIHRKESSALASNGSIKKSMAPIDIVPEITHEELYRWIKMEKLFQMIDVREPYEPDNDQLKGERIPMAQLIVDPSQVSRLNPVILYCSRGERSAQIALYLQKKHQFNNVYSLKGGCSMDL